MQIKSTVDNIIVLTTETQYELAATFLRVQEFYESPEFKDTVFDLEEYMDWYASEFGNFTYYSDWNGFNVPGHIMQNFFKLFKDQLNNKEQNLYDMLKEYINGKDKFYVIGLWNADNTVQHETSHALFYLDPEYKKEMLALLKKVPKDFIHHSHKVLQKEGYHPVVHNDECIAYFATNTMPDFVDMFGKHVPWDTMLPIQLAFDKRYENYIKSN